MNSSRSFREQDISDFPMDGHYSRDNVICSVNAERSQQRPCLKLKSPSELGINQNGEMQVSPGCSNCKKRRRSSDEYEEEKIFRKDLYKDMLKFPKEHRIWMHKVHVLCLIAYGNRINSIINDEFVMGALLSLVPCPLIPTGPIDSDYFLDLVEWFRCVFVLSNIKLEGVLDYRNFVDVFQTRRVTCIRDYVMLFVSMLRALGFNARYVMSLQPYPINVNDFEVVLPNDPEVIDTPGDYIISLKKGQGYVKSRKGKDFVTVKAVERLNNPRPIPQHRREKIVIKKYRTVLVAAVRRKNVKLDHWIEVFVKKERRWMSVNIIHQTVEEIDSIYDNLTFPLKYCLAWSNCNNLVEVTKSYAHDWYKGTSKRRADKQWVDSTFAIFDKRSAKRGRID